MLTTHLYLSSKGRIRGAVSLLPLYAFMAMTGTTLPCVLIIIIIIIIIKEIPRTGERKTCYVEAGCSTSGPDSNFSYGNNSKVTVTKFKET
jgi:hypothetical protein